MLSRQAQTSILAQAATIRLARIGMELGETALEEAWESYEIGRFTPLDRILRGSPFQVIEHPK